MKQIGLICSLLILWSCSGELEDDKSFVDPNPNDVEIRVDNLTGYLLKNFRLNSFALERDLGQIGPATVSNYFSFPHAFSYVGLNFDVNKVNFDYSPTEYQTDERLEGDRYEILIIDLDTIKQTFTFQLRFVE